MFHEILHPHSFMPNLQKLQPKISELFSIYTISLELSIEIYYGLIIWKIVPYCELQRKVTIPAVDITTSKAIASNAVYKLSGTYIFLLSVGITGLINIPH